MNKHILIIAGLLIANQSFADIGATNGVPDAATCNSGVLDTESGGAALQAQYIPETIALQWYDSNTLLNVTSTNSDSCTYGTGINLPTNPTKTGYKFTGWKVRPQYDFSTLATKSSAGIIYAHKGTKGNNNFCRYSGNGIAEESTEICNTRSDIFHDLSPYEWKIVLSWGILYGTGLCSNESATQGDIGSPTESQNGGHCWCKITGYIPTNENTKYASLAPLPWVYDNSMDSLSCNMYCGYSCSAHIINYANMHNHAFGVTGS